MVDVEQNNLISCLRWIFVGSPEAHCRETAISPCSQPDGTRRAFEETSQRRAASAALPDSEGYLAYI